LVLALTTGCRDQTAAPRAVSSSGIRDWVPACQGALAEAAALAPALRFRHVVDGCLVCGETWQPILADTPAPRLAVDALVKQCGGACSGSARDQFLASFDELTPMAAQTRPWRILANQCPAALPGGTRWASAQWFALHRIGVALAAEPRFASLVNVSLPLPASTEVGGGLELPVVPADSPSLRPAPSTQFTVLRDQVFAGVLSSVELGAKGLTPAPPSEYPGTPMSRPFVMRGMDRRSVSVLAPREMAAHTLLPVISALATAKARMAVLTAPSPGWSLPWVLAPVLQLAPSTHDELLALRVSRPGDGMGRLTSSGEVIPTCATGVDLAAQGKAHGAHPAAALVLDDASSVQDLADAVARAGAAAIEQVFLVKAPWPEANPCDQGGMTPEGD
jgi:hypothetical protein